MTTHGSVTMVYDGDGNRVSEIVGGTTTKYLVDSLNQTGAGHLLRRWLAISNRRTPAATETLIESQPPRMGMRTTKSAISERCPESPAGHRRRRAL